MINPMIMQLKIELSETQKELFEVEVKIKRLFIELQNLVNPYFKSFDDIKAEEIEQCADELLKCKNKAKQMQRKISDIKSQLGE